MAEVPQRAGVSKGVVTYHFAAKNDLIFAVVARIFDSITDALESRLRDTSPETFVADYINAWVEYYRTDTSAPPDQTPDLPAAAAAADSTP